MNLYTGQFIPDRNQDGVPDILNIHGGDPLGEPGRDSSYWMGTKMEFQIHVYSIYMEGSHWENQVKTVYTGLEPGWGSHVAENRVATLIN